MNERYAMHVRFQAKRGKGGALAAVLLEAAAALDQVDDCLLYVISRDPGDADVVFVTEAWTTQEAHDAALEDRVTRELIGRAMPLIEGRPQAASLRALGGKGV